MKNIMKKAISLALCATMLFTFGLSVWAENVEEAVDVGDNYVYYGTYLSVGEGEYTMSELYDYTLFGFAPTEEGKYTFTVANGLIGIASYNAMWINIQPSETTVTESTISWECTGVGQEIWVAVITEDAAASISITAGESERVVTEKIEYVNKVTPEAFTFPGDTARLMNVNVMNSAVDTAVLGDDGYYHLNSADGYILYANLNDSQMSLSAATSYGQLKGAVYNDDGELTTIVDYNNAFAVYFECADAKTGLYPLTEDLIEMFKEVGDNQGWYGSGGWLGYTKDDAWMFACYYTDEVFEEETYTPGDINNDGAINAVDSNLMKRVVGGQAAANPACDLDGDGKVLPTDANLLARKLSGK